MAAVQDHYRVIRPAFNSQCPYHSRRCKCSLRTTRTSSGTGSGPSRTIATVQAIDKPSRGCRRTLQTVSGVSQALESILDFRTDAQESSVTLPSRCASAIPVSVGGLVQDGAVKNRSHRQGSLDRSHRWRQGLPRTPMQDGKLRLGIPSPDMSRVQIRTAFLSHYLPSDLPNAGWLLETYSRWFDARCKSMRTAVDSCLLLHCAIIRDDQHVAHLGQTMHAQAVQSLRTELTYPDVRNDDAVLCTIYLLALCCRLRRLEDSDRIHYDGLMAVLRSRKADLVVQSELARTLVLNLIPRALTLALQGRRRLLFGEPSWQQALIPYCEHSLIQQVILISCRIPNVLQARDELVRGPEESRASTVNDLLREACSIKRSLESVLVSWYARSTCLPFWPVDLNTHFSHFSERLPHGQSNIFPFESAFSYQEPSDAVYHNWYRVAVLCTCESMIDLLSLPATEDCEKLRERAKTHNDLVAQCNVLVDEICRTIPFICCEGSARRFGSSVWNQTFTAQQWYRRIGNEEKVGWCEALLQMLKQEEAQASVRREMVSIDEVFCWMMLVS